MPLMCVYRSWWLVWKEVVSDKPFVSKPFGIVQLFKELPALLASLTVGYHLLHSTCIVAVLIKVSKTRLKSDYF